MPRNGDLDDAALIAARWAFQLALLGELEEAGAEYGRAAGLWGRVADGEEEAAECFFSAQTAASLNGEFFPSGWGWRPVAASMRGDPASFAARAANLENAGRTWQLREETWQSRREIRRAIRLRRQGGHLRGWLAAHRALADCELASEDFTAAALAYCACGDGRRAAKAAGQAPSRRLCAELPIGEAEWSTRASIAVLEKIGRWASEERAAELAPELLTRARHPNGGYAPDLDESVGALGQIAFALPDSDLPAAAARLEETLGDENRLASKEAARSLAYLHDCGRREATRPLLADFAADPGGSPLGAEWVSRHLDADEGAAVRSAALRGDPYALLALLESDLGSGDEEIEEACREYGRAHLRSDLGCDEEGRVHGLIALDLIGRVAAASPERVERTELAEKLLLYALEDRWPLVNRAAAVRGMAALATTLDPSPYLEQIRPLVEAETDAFEAAETLGQDFSEPGDLEAAALFAAVEMSTVEPPGWLRKAISAARLDQRHALRIAAWQCMGRSEALSVEGLEFALLDPKVKVRVAALWCWRQRMSEPPALPALERLVIDEYTEVRVGLVYLLAEDPSSAPRHIVASLESDADAWVRRLTTYELRSEPRSASWSRP